VPVGALNMDEYAYGFTTENSHYGPVHNPHDPARVRRRLVGWSAAAVAADSCRVARPPTQRLDSGSRLAVRRLRVEADLWPAEPGGARLFAASFDHVGPFARSVGDLAAAYDAMQGPDPRDPVCADGRSNLHRRAWARP